MLFQTYESRNQMPPVGSLYDFRLTVEHALRFSYSLQQRNTEFSASIPTVWNETRIIDGEVGEWIITARRNNSIWYVGGITNWTSRDVKLDLSFLPQGKYKIEIFKDGINADRNATDYKKDFFVTEDITKIHKLHLAPGGGFAMKIEGYLP